MTNYKHQYEAMKKMVEEYQDELIPGFRAKIAELETKLKEAEPVRHGRWEKSRKYKGYCSCSLCHDCYIEPEWVENLKWKYFPTCGAKMDLEVHNDSPDI